MIPDLLILAVVVVGFLYACGSLSAHSERAANTSAPQQHERLRTALICLFNSKYKFATKQVSWLRHPETGKQLTLQHFSSELSLLVHVEYKSHAAEKLRRVIVDSGVVYVGVPSGISAYEIQRHVYKKLPARLQRLTVLFEKAEEEEETRKKDDDDEENLPTN